MRGPRVKHIKRTDTMARKLELASRSVERIERIEDVREVNASVLAGC